MRVGLFASNTCSLINFRGPLIQAIHDLGHRVVAIGPPDPAMEARVRATGAEFHPVHINNASMNPLHDLRLFAELCWRIRRLQLDHFLSYTIKCNIWGSLAARAAGVRNVSSMVTGLGTLFTDPPASKRNEWLRKAVLRVFREALHRNDVVFFQNPDDRQTMVGWGVVEGENTRRIHGSGVDLDHYTTVPLTRHPARILFIGRLLRNKGIFEFVEAIRFLKQTHPEILARIVGETLDHPSLVPPAKLEGWIDEGLVEHTGWVDDVRPHLAWCNLLVLPSYREGTPRSVLEALATGRPVITTDVPGCREVVTHGKNGLLVPAKDAGSLAEAMKELVEDPDRRAEFATAGLALARDLYDVRKVNNDILEGMGLISRSP